VTTTVETTTTNTWEKTWNKTNTPGSNPPGGNPPSGGENPPPVIEIPDEPVPLAPPPADVADEVVEILDEEVPLANIPVTGDASLLWVVLSALSGTGLAGLSFAGKKREEEI
jgi:LPXTG-motif cell wall-anchored protein